MKSVLLVFADIIFLPIAESYPRSCVQCTSNEDGDCAIGLRLKKFTQECPKLNSSALVGTEAIGCRKIVHSRLEQEQVYSDSRLEPVEDTEEKCFGRYCPSKFIVVRECAYVGKDQHDKRTMINSGKRFTYYQCSNGEDEFGMPCNHASAISLTSSLLVASVTLLLS